MTNSGAQKCLRISRLHFTPQTLPPRPTLQPLDSMQSLCPIARPKPFYLRPVAVLPVRIRPLCEFRNDAYIPDLSSQSSRNDLMSANGGMHMIHVPILARN